MKLLLVSCLTGLTNGLTVSQRGHQVPGSLVHFIHTNEAKTFSMLNQRSIESVFFHHPEAEVILHTLHKDAAPILTTKTEKFRAKGFNLKVQAYDLEKDCAGRLATDGPADLDKGALTRFTKQISDYYKGDFKDEYWFAQSSDVGRCCMMYFDGGVYLDTDIIVVNRLDTPEMVNAIGVENAQEAKDLGGKLGNAVLSFDARNPFIEANLRRLVTRGINAKDWGANGPMLFTETANEPQVPEWKRSGALHVREQFAFFPISWRGIQRVGLEASPNDPSRKKVEEGIKKKRVSMVHVYAHQFRKDRRGEQHIPNKSLVYKLLAHNCVFCKEKIGHVEGN